MKVSKHFLNDYIDISDIDYQKLADDLVSIGNEYDSIYDLIFATDLVIGEITSCKMHPESDKLHICMVNIGKKTLQIICGAPNVALGQKVIVAQVGSKLGDKVIKKARLAGKDSEGMICALGELGIVSKYLSEADKKGIHVLPDDAPVGKDPIEYLGLDDKVIDFDFTSNRADMLSYLGIAYEVGAKYNRDVKYPETKVPTINEDINDIYSLNVETDKCDIYLGRMVKNVTIKESPNFIKNRLIASGIRPINNVVDISNYVMLEYGTPLHFFDADSLGNKVVIRNAYDNETLVTLDGIKRVLSKDDIVIADNKKAVALAGVMGGLDTEVEKDTKNIFVESAIFNATSIRLTSKKILRSEASNRFEKGVDPNRSQMAIDRACYLLNKYANGQVLNGMVKHDTTDKSDKKIVISLDKINKVLGMNLTADEVKEVLLRLKFKVKVDKNITVYVPTRRLDVNIKEDIIEEVGRIYGYDKIKSVLPTLHTKIGSYSSKERLSKSVASRLRGLGLSEVRTYSLLDTKKSDMFIDEEYNKIALLDPISEEHKFMRNSLIPSLLDVYFYNEKRNIKNVNIYEIASVYRVEDDYIEENRVACLMTGEYLSSYFQGINVKVDFYTLKGVVENLLKFLGFNNRYKFVVEPLKDMHPGRCGSIVIDKKTVGKLGEVHPDIAKDVYVFELSLDEILNLKVKSMKAKAISKYPSINKDVAFVTDKSSLEIEKVIKHSGGRLLTDVKVFDVYEMGNQKSIAYSLTFNGSDRTLTEDEVTNIFEKIIKDVQDKTGAKLRG